MTSLLYGVAGKLVGELCSPVFQDYVGKPWGFGSNDELERLKNTISTIEAVLLDAEEKQRTNHQVRDWLKKVKLVFYDLEDLFQEVTTEALRHKVRAKNKKAKKVLQIFSSPSNYVINRFQMGRKVKLITERLDAIASDRNRFNLAERHEEIPAVRSRTREETHSFVPEENVIGRDEDKKYVTRLLLESDAADNVSVISIVGIGGLGKTTLAQAVYSSEEVKGNFELMMWVCVSDVFDVKLISEKIVESATRNKCKSLQMDILKDELKEAIDGTKYLLVLDDVWNENPVQWMRLEELLRGGAKGSKILITSRSGLVAQVSNSIEIHFLKGFSHEESWALFKKLAFKGGVEPESSTIVGIGKEVVRKCAGVPLAIKTIGSMLGLKKRETDWLDFSKNDLPRITEDSVGEVASVLKLSYDHLSTPLKRCFAYCAIFPKDYEFLKEKLIMLWVVEGRIQLDGTLRSLEDVGEQYFRDLLDRSFFEMYDRGYGWSYKMHDLIHDLALSIGGNEYCNLGTDAKYIDETTRHAWVPPLVPTNLFLAKKLRTLIVRSSHSDRLISSGIMQDGDTVNEIMSMFKQLRVLVLACLNIASVPHFVGGLSHLNFLDLSYNKFISLPESISRLYNLQTLRLESCEKLKELPKGMRNLVSLRYLYLEDCNNLSHMPGGLAEMTGLCTLTDFFMGQEGSNCCELGELKNLVNLSGDLSIRSLRGSRRAKCKRGQSFILTQLKLIENLMLWWSDEEELKEEESELLLFEDLKPHSNLKSLSIIGYGGKKFPSWINKVNIGVSLPNISSIALDRCKSWRHLSPFGLLPSLRELSLWSMDGMEYIHDQEEDEEWNNNGSSSAGGPKAPDQLFPSLKELSLSKLPNSQDWWDPHQDPISTTTEFSLS